MEEQPHAAFTDQLDSALIAYKEYLNGTELPKLKEKFRFFHNSFQSLYNILIRKGLLQEDPYKNEIKLSEVETPPTGPMKESEKTEAMSRRLAMYDSILEFLNNYYQFQIEYINLSRLKKLVELTTYIKWNQLSETSANLNTRVFTQIIHKLAPQGSSADDMSHKIVNDSLQQLAKLSKEIVAVLKKITTFQKEHYKYQVRLNVTDTMRLKPEAINSRREEVVKAIKRKFAQVMPEEKFYPELVEEILEEDYGPQAEKLRRELLERLAVRKEQPKKKQQKDSAKTILLNAGRLLSAGAGPLEQAIAKLQYNSNLLDTKKLTFSERFRRWLFNLTNREQERKIYEVEYLDPKTGTSKSVKLEFNSFIESLQKRSKIIAGLGNRMSVVYQKLEAESEEKVYSYLTNLIEELQSSLLKLPALDEYFKTEVSRTQRSQVKSVRLETTALKNAVVKANQKRHEYVAQKEESEQLKRLGVSGEEG
jgi:hypothetical protein